MFVEGKPRTVFFLQTLYFTAFTTTVETRTQVLKLGPRDWRGIFLVLWGILIVLFNAQCSFQDVCLWIKDLKKKKKIYLFTVCYTSILIVSGIHEIGMKNSSLAPRMHPRMGLFCPNSFAFINVLLIPSLFLCFVLIFLYGSLSTRAPFHPSSHFQPSMVLSFSLSLASGLRLLFFLLRSFSYSLTLPQRFLFCCVLQWRSLV